MVLFPGGEGLGNDSMKPEESAQLHLDTLNVGVGLSGNVTTHLLGIIESHAPTPQALVQCRRGRGERRGRDVHVQCRRGRGERRGRDVHVH